MRFGRLFAVMFAVVFVGVVTAQAEEVVEYDTESYAETDLGDIVITPTKTLETATTVPSTFTIIDQERIAARGVTQVKDILNDVPGLHVVQTGNYGSPVSVFMRGTNSYHTLVLIDGVKVYDPMHMQSAYNLAYLTLDNIERIEVVRGNYSTLYGSDAIGGVINIITKKGSGKPKMFISAEGGSFGTYKTSVGLSGETHDVHYSFDSSWLHTDGISKANSKLDNLENDAYENFTVSSRLDYDMSDSLTVGSTLRFTNSDTELDNGGGTRQDLTNYKEDHRELVLSSFIDYYPTDWLDSKFRVSWIDNYRNYKNGPFYPVDNKYAGQDLRLDWQNTFYLAEYGNFIGGVDWHREEAYSRGTSATSEAVSANLSTENTGMYTQTKLTLFDSLHMITGARLDHHSKFGFHDTYKAALKYVFQSTDTSLKGGWSMGYKAPSMYQLYNPGSGNTSLKPEESNSFELGIEQKLWEKVIKAEHVFFWNEMDNLIIWVPPWPGQYENGGKARMYGFEDIFEYQLFDKARIVYTYTYLRTLDRDSKQQLNRRPRHKHHASVTFTPTDKLTLDVSCLYVGERKDARWPGQIILGDYFKVNLSGRYQINEMFEVYGRIENALDEDYEEVDGYGTPGISFFGGAKMTF